MPDKALSRCTACDRWVAYEKPTVQEVVALELGEGDWSWPIEVVCPTCGRRWEETAGVRVSMIGNRPHPPPAGVREPRRPRPSGGRGAAAI